MRFIVDGMRWSAAAVWVLTLSFAVIAPELGHTQESSATPFGLTPEPEPADAAPTAQAEPGSEASKADADSAAAPTAQAEGAPAPEETTRRSTPKPTAAASTEDLELPGSEPASSSATAPTPRPSTPTPTPPAPTPTPTPPAPTQTPEALATPQGMTLEQAPGGLTAATPSTESEPLGAPASSIPATPRSAMTEESGGAVAATPMAELETPASGAVATPLLPSIEEAVPAEAVEDAPVGSEDAATPGATPQGSPAPGTSELSMPGATPEMGVLDTPEMTAPGSTPQLTPMAGAPVGTPQMAMPGATPMVGVPQLPMVVGTPGATMMPTWRPILEAPPPTYEATSVVEFEFPTETPTPTQTWTPSPTFTRTPKPPTSTPTDTPTATATPEWPVEARDPAASTAAITGPELREWGAQTLAEAVQDITGLDAYDGSDQGGWVSNIGVRGIQELEALQITIDGVSAGGPFLPSLTRVFPDDVETVELVRGPQATRYGMEAYSGSLRVTTRNSQSTPFSISAGGSSLSEFYGSAGWSKHLGTDTQLRVSASGHGGDGWQERTERTYGELSGALDTRLGEGDLHIFLFGYSDEQGWGSPVPYEGEDPISNWDIDQNYAVGGAVEEHQTFGLIARLGHPLGSNFHIQDTLGISTDQRKSIRSFPFNFRLDDSRANAFGFTLEPEETGIYNDLSVATRLHIFGEHRARFGVQVVTGSTDSTGNGFEFNFDVTPGPAEIPLSQVTNGDELSQTYDRTLLGIYIHDEWTPTKRLTFAGGGRFSLIDEQLTVTLGEAREQSQDYQGFTGDISAVYQIVADGTGSLRSFDVYGAARHNFKPPTANLEALDAAQLFRPEWNDTYELGFRTNLLENRLSINLSGFYTSLDNRVAPIRGSRGGIAYNNGGEEQIAGGELELAWRPTFLEGLSIRGGYANYDTELKAGTYVTFDGDEVNVTGNESPLVPRGQWNLKATFARERGFGGFLAARGEGTRKLDPTNEFTAPSFVEFDAGLSYSLRRGRIAIIGRNLADERHISAASDMIQSQFYYAPAFRVQGELTVRF